LQEIFKLVKKHNSETTCIADGAQSVPHMPVDVTELKADFLAFSGHKMCGPMGIGVLWAKKSLLEKMPPFLAGGDMIAEVYLDHSTYNQVPQKFEAGTPNVAGAVGLKAACDYLATIGMENIHAQEQKLVQYAYEKLTHFPQIKILGPKDFSKRSGIITFEYLGVHAHDVAQILNSVGVAVRSGHHCTMPLHKSINLAASTRISTYFYNTREDIDQVITGLKKVQKIFKL
jgi:cysteine desulfurase/selenocysteine lyase